MATTDDANDTEAHREWGKRTNQRVWALLADGVPADEAARRELVDAAHASMWHWGYAGGALEQERGEWLLSHVYARTGNAPEALRHAQRCHEITEAEGFEDFDRAYAYEALARAYGVAGDTTAAHEWRQRAIEAGELIANDEDRSIFEGDLATG